MNIINADREVVTTVRSDAEGCRWWLDNGSDGDRLAETSELLCLLVNDIIPEATWTYNSVGNVINTTTEMADQ